MFVTYAYNNKLKFIQLVLYDGGGTSEWLVAPSSPTATAYEGGGGGNFFMLKS